MKQDSSKKKKYKGFHKIEQLKNIWMVQERTNDFTRIK